MSHVMDDHLTNLLELRLNVLLSVQRRGALEPEGKVEIKRIEDALAHRLPGMQQEGRH
ncbi:hypothetical protein RKD30_007291 [Streptomyces pristinaespiralis]